MKVWEVCFAKSGEFKEVVRAFDLKGHSAGVHSFAFSNDSRRYGTLLNTFVQLCVSRVLLATFAWRQIQYLTKVRTLLKFLQIFGHIFSWDNALEMKL